MLPHTLDRELSIQFIEKLKEYNFDSDTINKLSGKQLTRYVRISHREEFYLLSQVLYEYPVLLDLVNFLLLGRQLSVESFKGYFGRELFDYFNETGFIKVEDNKVHFSAYLTPLNGKYFLNDGDPERKPQNHVFAISQEQPYLIETCNFFLDMAPKPSRILDICTGSGVIGQSVQTGRSKIHGVDINPRAISYSKFNAMINDLDAEYDNLDIREAHPNGTYDLVVSNPPYNSFISDSDREFDDRDVTVHSGFFGDEVPNKILDISYDILEEFGMFTYVGTWLMKDGRLAHPEFERLVENGTLMLIHQPIVDIMSWEGLRRLFGLLPSYENLSDGFIHKKIREANYFNEVTWGILIYRKNGNPGFHKIYNVSTDAVLLPELVKDRLRNISTIS